MRAVRTLLVVLLLFCALFFGALMHSRVRGKHFTAITPGITSSTVLERVGKPSRSMACSALPEPPDNCLTVLVYAGPLSAVMPEYWLLPLDAKDRVIRVLHSTRAD